jgi:hypothetical protein
MGWWQPPSSAYSPPSPPYVPATTCVLTDTTRPSVYSGTALLRALRWSTATFAAASNVSCCDGLTAFEIPPGLDWPCTPSSMPAVQNTRSASTPDRQGMRRDVLVCDERRGVSTMFPLSSKVVAFFSEPFKKFGFLEGHFCDFIFTSHTARATHTNDHVHKPWTSTPGDVLAADAWRLWRATSTRHLMHLTTPPIIVTICCARPAARTAPPATTSCGGIPLPR